ncbi:ISBm1, transposase orfA [Citreicella sp. 357]|nr:ISBm1, transposase orfA [Citreicella sp. 357]
MIQPMPAQTSWGANRADDRRVLKGLFWWLRTGAPWASIPGRYGPHTTCPNRCNRRRRVGTWSMLLQAFPEDYDGDFSASIRGHQHGTNDRKMEADPVARAGVTPKATRWWMRSSVRSC